jgi:hypothetical protein
MTKEDLRSKSIEERRDIIVDIISGRSHRFGMFSKAGGKRCQSLIIRCVKKVMGNKALRQKEFEDYVSAQVQKVNSNEKYSEITDSAVREGIYYWIELAIEMSGYDWHDDFEYSAY